MGMLAPTTLEELAEAVRGAARLEIRGGGTKADIGAPREADILDMRGFTGVVDYDPAELVLTVRAGTPLAEVRALLATHRQMLAFEPYGAEGATIGGAVAAGVSGPRRVSAGAARDHLLGFVAVSGRGEILKAGGKVVKNVTGFDLPKLMAGSWGRLAALAELSLKVLPAPDHVATRALHGLDVESASLAMARALGSTVAPAAVAHLEGATLFRIEGFRPSVEARCTQLERMFDGVAPEGNGAWAGLHDLPGEDPLWRISIPARGLPRLAATLDGPWRADWGGALVWARQRSDPRPAAVSLGGHAMLYQAAPEVRRAVSTFHPQPAGNAALEARVVAAFDPKGVFATGRFDAH